MTSRLHLVDMPTHLGLAYVPLDGIGCTFALVKAHVHREGVTFPTFVFDNEVSPAPCLLFPCCCGVNSGFQTAEYFREEECER